MAAPPSFASDNNAPVHPEVLAAIAAADAGAAPAYGDDAWSARFEAVARRRFGAEARAFPVFNGTGANVVALAALLRPHQAVLCARGAHADVDECAAPERFTGSKLVPIEGRDGKLAPADVAPWLTGFGDVHRVQPRVLSISQATELGTVYRPAEVRALAELAHAHGMLLHVDGARLANAAAALDLDLGDLTAGAGVDVVSLGGTKCGALAAEAVVFLRAELAAEAGWVRKQALQLASKQRYLAAQLLALYEGDLWRRAAGHANAMARRLAAALAGVPGVEITRPVEANAVFARLPRAAIASLRERARFYVWDEARDEVRWMCAWNTAADDVDAFARDVREVAGLVRG